MKSPACAITSAICVLALVSCATIPKGDRERAALHLQIGTGYLSNGQYPSALTELLKADQLDPHNPVILNNLGLTYYVRGKMKLAEDKFREALKVAKNFTEAKNNLSRILIESSRAPDAVKLLQEAEGDLTYQYPEKTLSNLGMAYFEEGQYQLAEETLARSLEIRRQSCLTADFYGRTLLEMKRLSQSATALDQAIEYCRVEHYEEPLYFSAMSYFSLGNKEKSRARLQELLKDYPKSKYVTKSRAMLELLEQ